MSVVETPAAPLTGVLPVIVGAVSSAVVNENPVADRNSPLMSVAVPAMVTV